MFLGLCAVALLLLTPLWGGSLSRLSAVRVRGVWLAVAALALQVLVISVLTSLPRDIAVVGHLASYVMLFAVLWMNRRLAGIPLVALGVAANAVTIAVNGGTLPASRAALRAAGIHLRPGFDNSGVVAHPHLAWLGDTMVTPAWLPMRNMLSIGDLLLLVGAAVFVVVATRRSGVGESGHACAPATRAGGPAPTYEGLHRR